MNEQEYNHETISLVEIEVGSDGTDDEVHVEICSDVDNQCCDTVFNSWANDFRSKMRMAILCIAMSDSL